MTEKMESQNRTPEVPEPRLERHGNVVDIYKPEGTYTIIYGVHNKPQDKAQLPADLSGVVLETGSDIAWTKEPLTSLDEFFYHPQYIKLVGEFQHRKLPIFFMDTNTEAAVHDKAALVEAITLITETGAAGLLARDILKKLLSNPEMDRREFLKLGAKSTLAAWLGTPIAGYLGRYFSGQTEMAEGLTAEIEKASQKVHPEILPLLLKIRNCVIAEKEEWLATKLKSKPHLATVIGSLHVGLEDDIQKTSTDRLKFLKAAKPLIKLLYEPTTFCSIGRFDYEGFVWHATSITEVPALKEIVM